MKPLRFAPALSALVAAVLASGPVRAAGDPNAPSAFGVSIPLDFSPGSFDKDAAARRLKLLRDAGAKWTRCEFPESHIEPQPGQFRWDAVDWIVHQSRQAGLSLMPTLCPAPPSSPAPPSEADRARFANFVGQAVARYKADVHTWEITPLPGADPRDFAKLLRAASAEARKADPTCTIAAGIPGGIDYGLIEGLLQNNAADAFDAVSVQCFPGVRGSASPDAGGLAPSLRGVDALLAEYGHSKPLLLTLGHRSGPAPGGIVATPEQQAAHLVRAYVLARSARVQHVFWSDLADTTEPLGLVDAKEQPKLAFRAYQSVARHLSGKQCIGTLDLGKGVAAYVYAPARPGADPSAAPTLPGDPSMLDVVAWRSDDSAEALPVTLPGAKHDRLDGTPLGNGEIPLDARPVFCTGLAVNDLARFQPLPPLPPPNKNRRGPTKPALLPKTTIAWPAVNATQRFLVAVSHAEPPDAPVPIVIPGPKIPRIIPSNRRLNVYEPDARKAEVVAVADRDLDGNAVFVAPPSSQTSRYFYLYPAPPDTGSPFAATDDALNSAGLRIDFANRARATGIRLNNGYKSLSDESDGLFAAAYTDAQGATARLTDGTATVLKHDHLAGASIAQYRSRVAFGPGKCEYEFTYTLYVGTPLINYTGKWIRGAGATAQCNLADAFPAGTLVTGLYGQTTLPATGAFYSHAAFIRPANHPTVTAILVCPAANLRSTDPAPRSIVGAGLWNQAQFPATVSADYYWYESPPAGEAPEVLRRHYLRSAYPPVVTVGAFETRR